MSSQTMRPGTGSTSPSDPVLITSGSLHADQPTTNHDQSSSRYEAGYSSGSDARGSSGWVDADGSDDGGVSGASSSGGHSGAVTSGIGGGGGSGVGIGGGVGGVGINNGIDPIRRTRKRGRSLRKNVLLRTRGVLMSNLTTNGLGIITPGMVLGSENHSSLISSSHTIHALPPSPTVTHHDDDSSTSILSPKPNGVNDAVNSGYSSASPSFPSAFIDVPWAPPRNAFDPLADTVWWGWAILGMTWLVFVVGMGSILGVWEWAWDVGDHPIPMPSFLQTQVDDDADELPISGYYPALMILTIVIAWVWVIVAWVGMKYFKHAKIQPQSDDT